MERRRSPRPACLPPLALPLETCHPPPPAPPQRWEAAVVAAQRGPWEGATCEGSDAAARPALNLGLGERYEREGAAAPAPILEAPPHPQLSVRRVPFPLHPALQACRKSAGVGTGQQRGQRLDGGEQPALSPLLATSPIASISYSSRRLSSSPRERELDLGGLVTRAGRREGGVAAGSGALQKRARDLRYRARVLKIDRECEKRFLRGERRDPVPLSERTRHHVHLAPRGTQANHFKIDSTHVVNAFLMMRWKLRRIQKRPLCQDGCMPVGQAALPLFATADPCADLPSEAPHVYISSPPPPSAACSPFRASRAAP